MSFGKRWFNYLLILNNYGYNYCYRICSKEKTMGILLRKLFLGKSGDDYNNIGYSIGRTALESANTIDKSKLFYIEKYDNRLDKLMSRKTIFEYYIEFFTLYLYRVLPYMQYKGLNDINLVVNIANESIEHNPYGKYIMKREAVHLWPDTKQMTYKYVLSFTSGEFLEWVKYACRILSFRWTGFGREDYVWKEGNAKQKYVVSTVMADSFNRFNQHGFLANKEKYEALEVPESMLSDEEEFW